MPDKKMNNNNIIINVANGGGVFFVLNIIIIKIPGLAEYDDMRISTIIDTVLQYNMIINIVYIINNKRLLYYTCMYS